jgi:hemerythrin-like domain-containing protein
MTQERIGGPLVSWYDIHESLAFEIKALAEASRHLDLDGVDAFGERFEYFRDELRRHSEIEDGLVFASIATKGGNIDPSFELEHHAEQQLMYEIGYELLGATALRSSAQFGLVAEQLAQIRDSLVAHFQEEEDEILPQVPELFEMGEQVNLLHAILGTLPPDPNAQGWIVARLTPEHREARVRHMSQALPPEQFAIILEEIKSGVSPEIWADVAARVPDLIPSEG